MTKGATKTCTKCEVEYAATLEFFYQRKAGLHSHCKKCRRTAALVAQRNAVALDPDFNRNRAERRLWGKGAYAALVACQGEKCGACGRKRKIKRLHIDHCHETGVVRGLLCFKCNGGIGLFGDSPEALSNAVDYLTNPPCAHLGLTYKPFELELEDSNEENPAA